MGIQVLNGLDWLLLRFRGDRGESMNERARQLAASGPNRSRATADDFKESLTQVRQQPHKATGDRYVQ